MSASCPGSIAPGKTFPRSDGRVDTASVPAAGGRTQHSQFPCLTFNVKNEVGSSLVHALKKATDEFSRLRVVQGLD